MPQRDLELEVGRRIAWQTRFTGEAFERAMEVLKTDPNLLTSASRAP